MTMFIFSLLVFLGFYDCLFCIVQKDLICSYLMDLGMEIVNRLNSLVH